MSLANFTTAANLAALVNGTDYAAADNGNNTSLNISVLPLSMKGLRFLRWITAANGQPGLALEVPLEDILLLLLNVQCGLAGKGTAWTQT